MARSESPSISVSRRGSSTGETDRTVVWVRGEHDVATRLWLTLAIERAARADGADLLVDLSGVTFMDASIIGALIDSADRLRSRSQSLAVRAPSPSAIRVLDVCGLADLTHPAPVAVVHPSGQAAALSTWVEVSPSVPGERRVRATEGHAAHPVLDDASATVFTMVDAEVDRGEP